MEGGGVKLNHAVKFHVTYILLVHWCIDVLVYLAIWRHKSSSSPLISKSLLSSRNRRRCFRVDREWGELFMKSLTKEGAFYVDSTVGRTGRL